MFFLILKIEIKFYSFKAKSKLQSALCTFIATQILTQNEKEELHNTFKALDKDGDSKLSLDELIEGLANLISHLFTLFVFSLKSIELLFKY